MYITLKHYTPIFSYPKYSLTYIIRTITFARNPISHNFHISRKIVTSRLNIYNYNDVTGIARPRNNTIKFFIYRYSKSLLIDHMPKYSIKNA